MRVGRALAAQLGRLASATACELELPDGRRATLRVAKPKNTSWGCTHLLRDRVDLILCAETDDDVTFRVWALSASDWKAHAREASAGSKNFGRLSTLSRGRARSLGTLFATLRVT